MSNGSTAPSVSVIVVTYNPRRDLLSKALDSLERQTLPTSEFEVVVVDNNSKPPLEKAKLEEGRTLDIRLFRELRQGNVFARCTAIRAARAELIVFVDDDNQVDPDYLEQGLRIAREQPAIGAFGGIARPVFEGNMSPWKENLLPYLGVRDFGPEPITSDRDDWGGWEPIGAGMVFRRDVGLAFVDWMNCAPESIWIGRQGKALMSGEDALVARAAYRMGYSCSYQPALKMSHCMKASRLHPRILAGTLRGHGRSTVLLQKIMDKPVQKPVFTQACKELWLRYWQRVSGRNGLRSGTIEWFLDLGYFREAMRVGDPI